MRNSSQYLAAMMHRHLVERFLLGLLELQIAIESSLPYLPSMFLGNAVPNDCRHAAGDRQIGDTPVGLYRLRAVKQPV